MDQINCAKQMQAKLWQKVEGLRQSIDSLSSQFEKLDRRTV